MDEYIEKYLNDVLLSIEEVESYFAGQPKLFENFKNDILRQRAIERNVERRQTQGQGDLTPSFSQYSVTSIRGHLSYTRFGTPDPKAPRHTRRKAKPRRFPSLLFSA